MSQPRLGQEGRVGVVSFHLCFFPPLSFRSFPCFLLYSFIFSFFFYLPVHRHSSNQRVSGRAFPKILVYFIVPFHTMVKEFLGSPGRGIRSPKPTALDIPGKVEPKFSSYCSVRRAWKVVNLGSEVVAFLEEILFKIPSVQWDIGANPTTLCSPHLSLIPLEKSQPGIWKTQAKKKKPQ